MIGGWEKGREGGRGGEGKGREGRGVRGCGCTYSCGKRNMLSQSFSTIGLGDSTDSFTGSENATVLMTILAQHRRFDPLHARRSHLSLSCRLPHVDIQGRSGGDVPGGVAVCAGERADVPGDKCTLPPVWTSVGVDSAR